MSEETASMEPESLRRWRMSAGLLIALLLGLSIAYWPTLYNMGLTWWESSTYAHGWLVIPIVAFLVWEQRRSLIPLSPQTNPFGLLPLMMLVAVWMLARAAEVLVVQQFAVMGMVVCLAYSLLGGRVVGGIAFPLAYLFFAVPAGDGLVPPLQDLTAWFTVEALKLSGLPVLLEGRHISIPTGDFLVAEACSGVRYLIASLALGCLYAYVSYRSLWRRLAFIAVAGLLPIVANAIRAYGIVMLAYLTDHRLAVGVDHLIYGWLFFGLLIFLMFWIGSLWREAPVSSTAGDAPRPFHPSGYPVLVACGAGLVLALGPLTVHRMETAAQPTEAAFQAPSAPPGWQGPVAVDGAWAPVYLGSSGEFLVRYQTGNGYVEFFGVVYRQQQQGHELIHFDNRLFDDERWAYDGQETHFLANTGLNIEEIRLRGRDGRRRVLWHWYRIGETSTTSPVIAKFLEAWQRLRGGGAGSKYFALVSDYELSAQEARDRLTAFLDGLATQPGPEGAIPK